MQKGSSLDPFQAVSCRLQRQYLEVSGFRITFREIEESYFVKGRAKEMKVRASQRGAGSSPLGKASRRGQGKDRPFERVLAVEGF